MDKLRVHITYDNEIKLSDFVKIIDLLNKSVNDVIREHSSVNNRTIAKFSPTISSVERGSINIELTVAIIEMATAGIILIAEIVKYANMRLENEKEKGKNIINNNIYNQCNITHNNSEIEIHTK